MPTNKDQAHQAIEEAKARLGAKADSQRATTNAQICDNHDYHPPLNDVVKDLHEGVRNKTRNLALWLNERLPECDEKQEALKAVRLAMMWANAAIACHSNDE